MLKQFFEASSESMKLYFEQVTSQIDHNGEKGSAREEKIKELLEKYLPKKYSLTNGTITNSTDQQSRQVDIIIHDNLFTPILEDFQSSKVIPIESLYGIIEVKSTLSKVELGKCANNIKSTMELNPNPELIKIGCVFAYTSDSSLETIRKNLEELSKELPTSSKINCICVLDKGLIIPLQKNNLLEISMNNNEEILYGVIDNSNDALLLFYIFLLTMLNNTEISIPNLVNYAESGGLVEKTINIPTEAIPNDAMVDIGPFKVNFEHIKKMQNLQPKIEYFETGKMSEEELLNYVLDSYYLGTYEFRLDSLYTFLDKEITFKEMQQKYQLNLKSNRTPDEEEALNKFSKELYLYYQDKISDHN
ncbi:DUF6602 domain-containing protein [Aerococcus urinaeequi]|uniref:DUF6602 domain-containing protein n=1 Tax=Aerococcus urinaeequi TaxID=51665 RepID=UPI003B3A38A4